MTENLWSTEHHSCKHRRRSYHWRGLNIALALCGLLVPGQAAAVGHEMAAADGTEFGYAGNERGPNHWAELNGNVNEACEGMEQSPVDIRWVVKDKSLEALVLDLHETEKHVINNGHVIEQEYEFGSTLLWEGDTYDLLQFHFHTFSEHTRWGKHYPMELHAVFQNMGTGDLAVIGQFYRLGKENPFLKELGTLPVHKGDEEISHEIHLNLKDGLKKTTEYYTYQGSLTTPPCSEIVSWIVLKKVPTMSKEQFKEVNNILGNNFRPPLDPNGRTIRVTHTKKHYWWQR